jgi:glutathione S-transferase
MIKLYSHPLSGNCYKVRLLLNQLGVEYQNVFVDIFKGEHKTVEFAKINPNMKIPVLDDDGSILWESNAILLYLAEKCSPNPYISDETLIFGQIVQWLFFGKTTIDPNFAIARYYKKFLTEEQYEKHELTKLQKNCYMILEQLDKHFVSNEFLAGQYSVADIACYPYIKLSYQAEIKLDNYNSVKRWIANIEKQESYISIEG